MSRNPEVGLTTIYEAVNNERIRAHRKHGANGNSREDAPWDDKEWLPIVGEEFGEVCRWFTYDQHNRTIDDLYDELIQCSAMFTAWAAAVWEQMEVGQPG